MNVTILGSGSRGNALVIECDGDRLLVDAGFPARTLVARMRACGIAPESISALLLTHAHGDHATGARVAAKRFGWTVYATEGTIDALPDLARVSPVKISTQESLQLDTMRVTSVRTPHDCAEPIAITVEGMRSGARCGIAYDLGHVPASVARALEGVDALVLESNHDLEMLRNGPYPPSLQRRISGGRGHLSNSMAAGLARTIAHRGLRHLVLAHLSEQNNAPEVARRTMQGALRGTVFKGRLGVAPQDRALSFEVEHTQGVQQLDLF